MNPPDVDTVEVAGSADSPEFSDRGYSVVPGTSPEMAAVEIEAEVQAEVDAEVDAVKKAHRRAIASIESMSDEELMTEAGVEPIFSTTEAADFFDRSNQWLYWGLREGVFTDDDGVPLMPTRLGDPGHGRRRFTIPIIRDILRSTYRRGNIDPDHLNIIMRRIKYAERGIEWREQEGWRHVSLGRSRFKWVRPEDAEWDASARVWRERIDAKKSRRKPK
jgi:hypothetical protein